MLGGSPAIGDREHDRSANREKSDVASQRDHRKPIEFRVCAALIAMRSSRIAADIDDNGRPSQFPVKGFVEHDLADHAVDPGKGLVFDAIEDL